MSELLLLLFIQQYEYVSKPIVFIARCISHMTPIPLRYKALHHRLLNYSNKCKTLIYSICMIFRSTTSGEYLYPLLVLNLA